MMKPPFLIFDYDGTLHETLALYKSAVFAVVNRQKGQLLPSGLTLPSEEKLKEWIGFQAAQMWADYCPGLSEESRTCLIRQVGAEMNRRISTESKWYPGAEELLDDLAKAGYPMILLSNCTESYGRVHWDHFRMDRFFAAFLACESYGNIPKEQIVRALLDNPETVLDKAVCKAQTAGIEDFAKAVKTEAGERGVLIGDKASDRQAAEKNGLGFIGCLYGYGKAGELNGVCRTACSPAAIKEDLDILTA